MANHILTRGVSDTEGRRGGRTRRSQRSNEEVEVPFLRHTTMCDRKQTVATIGGANAHSRRDRLSFVTSFTLSNDTHCFWTRSYASRPCTWHRLEALLFPFFPRSTPISHLCLPFFLLLLPPASFRRYHRVSRFFFHDARAVETVEFDLLGLRDPERRKRPNWLGGKKSLCYVQDRFSLIWNEKLYEISSY